jgi:hypothetical protein
VSFGCRPSLVERRLDVLYEIAHPRCFAVSVVDGQERLIEHLHDLLAERRSLREDLRVGEPLLLERNVDALVVLLRLHLRDAPEVLPVHAVHAQDGVEVEPERERDLRRRDRPLLVGPHPVLRRGWSEPDRLMSLNEELDRQSGPRGQLRVRLLSVAGPVAVLWEIEHREAQQSASDRLPDAVRSGDPSRTNDASYRIWSAKRRAASSSGTLEGAMAPTRRRPSTLFSTASMLSQLAADGRGSPSSRPSGSCEAAG